jgi:hypothetical protein
VDIPRPLVAVPKKPVVLLALIHEDESDEKLQWHCVD